MMNILIFLVIVLAQAGCTFYEEHGSYQPSPFVPEAVQHYERLKRDLLQLEDRKVGEGPAITYWGMIGEVTIHNNIRERGLLSSQQEGIVLGLNGMAVGGKRRIVIPANMVCYNGLAVGQSLDKGADPNVKCGLVIPIRGEIGARVRKESLIVEATLTASCTPIFLQIPLLYTGQFRCRDSEAPKREASDPIWHFYHTAPSKP
jgi:hypothetical protein